MTDAGNDGLQIDSDWKNEAQAEKDRLAEEAKKQAAAPIPDASFSEIINLIAIQAAMSMGGFAGPDGKTHPPDIIAARHYVDLLGLLEEKTAGNVTDDEKKLLDGVLYELRMSFVASAEQASGAIPPAGSPGPDTPAGGGSTIEMP